MQLSRRLERLSELVRPGTVMADIGTDHGNLPAVLLQRGQIDFAVATDIHPKPLEKAADHLRNLGFSEKSDCRLGNGLIPLKPGECDDIVIAGMGGLMIRDILDAGEKTARLAGQLILQPMNNTVVLRQYLADNHYRIIHESIVEDRGYFYEVMVVQNGSMAPLTLAETVVGYAPVRCEDSAFQGFLKEHIRKTHEILNIVSMKRTENARRRAEECRILSDELEQLLEHITTRVDVRMPEAF